MASEKMTYWVAVAIMSLLLGNHFANKYQGSCLADRATTAVQRLSGEANHLLAMGQMALAGTPSFAGSEMAMARVQSNFASMEAVMARQQAACARVQAQHARILALQEMQQVRVFCPRQRLSVEVPQIQITAGTI